MTIFVQIAAYRDPELGPTVRDCIDKAAYPGRLRFGICHQRSSGEDTTGFEGDQRFSIVSVPFQDSKGVCWARSVVQSLYNGEEYTLQLDSHHRFAQNWDAELMAMLLATESTKPLLTAYAPAYDADTGALLTSAPCSVAFDRFTPEGATIFRPEPIRDHERLTGPVRARFFSAHFAFAFGTFADEVKYDPNLYFLGEEINMSVRAFTHGYDLFHPNRPLVWHEYSRSNRRKHWDDHVPTEWATTPWYVRDAVSHHRNRLLFGIEGGISHLGHYALGGARTLQEYEQYAGINFRLRAAQAYTIENYAPPNPQVFESDREWLQAYGRDFSAAIEIEDYLLTEADDFDFWYVGVHDEYGYELWRRDLSAEEVVELLSRSAPRILLPYKAIRVGHSWAVWPHSRSRGWLRKVSGRIG